MTAPDYGEPWEGYSATGGEGILRKIPGQISMPNIAVFQPIGAPPVLPETNRRDRNRTVACVNALAGCPDPVGSISSLRAVLNKTTEGKRILASVPELSWLREESNG